MWIKSTKGMTIIRYKDGFVNIPDNKPIEVDDDIVKSPTFVRMMNAGFIEEVKELRGFVEVNESNMNFVQDESSGQVEPSVDNQQVESSSKSKKSKKSKK